MNNARLSEAEWEVMSSLWSSGPLTITEIVESLAFRTGRLERTIRTLVERLVRKRAVAIDATAKPSRYYPTLQQEDCLREERRAFLDRVFGGKPVPLLLHLLRDHELTLEDIRVLTKALNEKAKKS